MKFSPKVKAIQLLENKKVGSTLIPDGLKGPYTNEVTWMAKKAMGLPINNIITKEFTRKLVEATCVLPESLEKINEIYIEVGCGGSQARKIYNWIVSKKPRTLLTLDDIKKILWICDDEIMSFEHCIAHLINESNWGTSYRIRYYNNGFGIGIYDSGDKYKLKYLTRPTSAFEWCYLLERRYISRGQNTEQKLNVSARRHKPEWFNLKNIKGFQNYATSQSKSVSCGLLVREMRRILSE